MHTPAISGAGQEHHVDPYRSEDEQVEALKRWWKDNGTSTLTSVALAIAVVLGWQGWQQRQQQSREVASATYQTMLEAIQAGGDKLTTAKTMADTLKADFSGSAYAQLAALAKARLLVEAKDLAGAEAELRWVLEHKPADEIKGIVQLRLAKVLSAKGDRAGALAALAGNPPEALAAAYAEARGDILLAEGKRDEAKAAYQQAIEQAKGQKEVELGWLEMKYQSLGGEPPAPRKEGGA